MKKLKFWLGGRPRTTDDLQNLQNQTALLEGALTSAGAFIYSGCKVSPNGSNYNVAAGLVYIDGKLLPFDGATNVQLPIELYAAAGVESDARPDANGVSHNAQVEFKAAHRPASFEEF